MFCTNCGNQIDEGAKFCTVCGKPLEPALPQKVETTPPANAYRNNYSGIILPVPIPVLRCRCRRNAAIYFSDSAGTSGVTGYVVSFFFLIADIVSIVCRKSKGGSIAAGVVYAFCGMALVQEDFSFFADLAFYCFTSFVFGGIMIIGGALQKPRVNEQ